MMAVPLLGGAVLRLVWASLTDHIGAAAPASSAWCSTLVPLLLGWLWADSSRDLLVGLLLGVAGASFAAALPLASRWYPPQYQGLAMGIAGAGNSGTALATLFAPRLAEAFGWHGRLRPRPDPDRSSTLVVFVLFAKDSPTRRAPSRSRTTLRVLRQRDTWWFCLLLLGDVRRLRRPGQLPHHLLPRPVRPAEGAAPAT